MSDVKGLLLISFLFCCTASFSQLTIQGKVLTEVGGKPISYVNIGILNSSFGTISNYDGSFYITIPSTHANEDLIFSAIGYETETIAIKKLAIQKVISIHLTEKITYLDEVVFTYSMEKKKQSWLGNSKRHLMVQGQMYLDSISAGGAMALLVKKEDESLNYIKKAMVFITKNTEPSFKVRVRFLRVDSLNNNLPGEDLINESIVVTSGIRRGWLKFDLSPYTLSVKETSFYVGFEWILEDSDRLRIFSKLSEFRKLNPQKIHRDTVIIDGVETPIEDFSSRDPIPVIAFGDTRTKSDLENYLCYTRSNSFGGWERSTGIVSAKILMSNKPYFTSFSDDEDELNEVEFNDEESFQTNIKNWGDSFIDNYYIPGMQLSISSSGAKLYSDGFGYFDVPNKKKVTDQTRFRIASVSKTLTSAAVIKLASEGKLDLDADVRNYVPSFPVKKHSISTLQLLGHLGGIRDYYEISTDELFNNPHFDNATEAISVFKNDSLMSKPGDQFLYSSFGYNLLGAVIENASGQTYLDYMQGNIWKPLQMHNTYGDIKDSTMVNKSKFYYPNEEEAIPFDLSYNHPAGGLIATSDDLVLFGNELLTGDFFKSDFKKELFQTQYTVDQTATSYGLGWYIGEDMNGHRIWYHAGEGPSTGALLLLYPDDDIVISLLTNTPILTNAPDGLPLEVLKLGAFLYTNGK
ncbi:MAG: serine hydrolase [Ekhidna sp.]